MMFFSEPHLFDSYREIDDEIFQRILSGYYTLIDLQVPREGLFAADAEFSKLQTGVYGSQNSDVYGADKLYMPYYGVNGVFCRIHWSRQMENPAAVPMFRDILGKCSKDKKKVVLDLAKVVEKTRNYDIEQIKNGTAVVVPTPPTLAVFHETRCGSTLVSNVLAASWEGKDSNENSNVRVYSESPAHSKALRACDQTRNPDVKCDAGVLVSLVRDVFYLTGRMPFATSDDGNANIRTQVYYKMQASGVRYVEEFAMAFPNTPWAYVYRDSIEVIMSHFKEYMADQQDSKRLEKKRQATEKMMTVCLRSATEAQEHPLMTGLLQQYNRTKESLSREEYCAAHLATLNEAAIQQYERTFANSSTGSSAAPTPWLLNYRDDLPETVWKSVLPTLLNKSLTPDQISRMREVTGSYSKGRGPKEGLEWRDDGEVKQEYAPESVKQAVALFLEPTYEKLELIRKSLLKTKSASSP
jgi:hypothetical protein